MGTEVTNEDSVAPAVSINHPIFWFDDGTLILDVEQQRFKVHRTLLTRHSKTLAGLVASSPPSSGTRGDGLETTSQLDEAGLVIVRPKKTVRREDIEALLEHLYHDLPITEKSSFSRVVSILRVSSPQQLDLPTLHTLARDILHGKFSSEDPSIFDHDHPLTDALDVTSEYAISAARKAILYTIVTTTEFDVEENPDTTKEPVPAPSETNTTHSTEPSTAASDVPKLVLSKSDAETCMTLMTKIIDHFTPILFTVPPAGHMDCTDLLAGEWMTLVIQPALADDGVYKPIETLERIKSIDWRSKGICESCVKDKHDEWTEEQRKVWRLMDEWLGSS